MFDALRGLFSMRGGIRFRVPKDNTQAVIVEPSSHDKSYRFMVMPMKTWSAEVVDP
jgi:hypothetical protein